MGEGACEVNVISDDLRGLDGDRGGVTVADLQGPGWVNLPGRSVNQDGTDVCLSVDPGEVADC